LCHAELHLLWSFSSQCGAKETLPCSENSLIKSTVAKFTHPGFQVLNKLKGVPFISCLPFAKGWDHVQNANPKLLADVLCLWTMLAPYFWILHVELRTQESAIDA
jgi:hypothetical protein